MNYSDVIQIKVLTTLQSKFQVSMAKIKNLNYTIKKNINFVFFGKFITALSQKLKKECNNQNYATRY